MLGPARPSYSIKRAVPGERATMEPSTPAKPFTTSHSTRSGRDDTRTQSVGPELCIWGGNSNDVSADGVSCLNLNNALSNSNWNIGARPTLILNKSLSPRPDRANGRIHKTKSVLVPGREKPLTDEGRNMVKRVGHRWERLMNMDTLCEAARLATRGRSRVSSVIEFNRD